MTHNKNHFAAHVPRCGPAQRLGQKLNFQLMLHPFKGASLMQQIISRFTVPPVHGPVICQTIYGFDLVVDPSVDKGIERDIYFQGYYEAGTISTMKHCLRGGDVFVDVGANIGLMSLAASKFVGGKGKVYAFEPEPEVFSLLQDNLRLNQKANVYAHNIALGSASGKATLHRHLEVNRGSASLVDADVPGQEVILGTLDEVVPSETVSCVRMLKIDVEGWELEVLKGAAGLLRTRETPILCIEYSKTHQIHGGRPLDVYAFIKSINDYRVFKLKNGKEKPSKLVEVKSEASLPRHDNLFCFLPSHLQTLPRNMFG